MTAANQIVRNTKKCLPPEAVHIWSDRGPKPYKAKDSHCFFNLVRLIDFVVRFQELSWHHLDGVARR